MYGQDNGNVPNGYGDQQNNYGQPQQNNYGQPQQNNYGQPQQDLGQQDYSQNQYGQQTYNQNMYAQNQNYAPKKKSKKPLIIGIVIGVLLILGLGCFGIIKLFGSIIDSASNNDDYDDYDYEYSDDYEDETDEDDVDITEDDEEDKDNEDKEDKDEVVTKPSENDSAWTSYKVVINDKEITLPCTYAELAEATGLSMKSSDQKSYLEGEHYVNVNLYNENDDLCLYTDILNESKEDMIYTDCKVISVWQTDHQIENGSSLITFPKGIYVGMETTTADLKKTFGEPYDIYEYRPEDDPDYWSDTLEWIEEDTYGNKLEVVIINGVITEIQLDHKYF